MHAIDCVYNVLLGSCTFKAARVQTFWNTHMSQSGLWGLVKIPLFDRQMTALCNAVWVSRCQHRAQIVITLMVPDYIESAKNISVHSQQLVEYRSAMSCFGGIERSLAFFHNQIRGSCRAILLMLLN